LKKKNDPSQPSILAQPSMWKDIFQKYVGKFLESVKEDGMYQASYIVFLLSDENGHAFGFESKQYEEAVQLLDHFVRGLVEGIEDKKGNHIEGLQELGIMNSMNWCICTDHGGREIDRSRIVAINTIIERELGLRLLEGHEEKEDKVLKSIKRDYSKLNAFTQPGSEVYHLWFGGHEGKKLADFTKFYGEKFFREIMPKKPIKTDDSETKPVDLIDYLIHQDYTQFVIIPEEDNPSQQPKPKDIKKRALKKIPREYILKIFSAEGTSKFSRSLSNGVIHYTYEIIDGVDPLGYQKENTGLEYGKPYSHEKWLESTIKLELPDVPKRLFGFFDCVYAPNMAVTSEFDWHFWSVYDVAEKKKKALKNHQNHDGLYYCESIVPLTFSGPDFKDGAEITLGRNADVVPTILDAMGIEFDEHEVDGKPLDEAINK